MRALYFSKRISYNQARTQKHKWYDSHIDDGHKEYEQKTRMNETQKYKSKKFQYNAKNNKLCICVIHKGRLALSLSSKEKGKKKKKILLVSSYWMEWSKKIKGNLSFDSFALSIHIKMSEGVSKKKIKRKFSHHIVQRRDIL